VAENILKEYLKETVRKLKESIGAIQKVLRVSFAILL
jgi:hypothetical protein